MIANDFNINEKKSAEKSWKKEMKQIKHKSIPCSNKCVNTKDSEEQN